MLQLLMILIALITGHRCGRLPFSQDVLNKFLNISVLMILLVMGYDFGCKTADITSEAFLLFKQVATFTILLFLFNFTTVYLFSRSRFNRLRSEYHIKENYPNYFSYVLTSFKYLIYVIGGIILGHYIKLNLIYLDSIISFMLFIMLFIIGHQLNQQGISLKSIITNKLGIIISITIIISSLLAGMLSAKILKIDMNVGVMLSSGFGWYTLSGILFPVKGRTKKVFLHYIGLTKQYGLYLV